MFNKLRQAINYLLNGLEEGPRPRLKNIRPTVNHSGMFPRWIKLGLNKCVDVGCYRLSSLIFDFHVLIRKGCPDPSELVYYDQISGWSAVLLRDFSL
jgi:hypothetical protein